MYWRSFRDYSSQNIAITSLHFNFNKRDHALNLNSKSKTRSRLLISILIKAIVCLSFKLFFAICWRYLLNVLQKIYLDEKIKMKATENIFLSCPEKLKLIFID